MGTPEPPEPQTLAAGELVWAKTKGRRDWWPARLRFACPAASKDAPVTCFGDDGGGEGPRPATRLRRFADPAADKMARASNAGAFLNAVHLAHAAAVALLCTDLTCACASPAAPAPAGTDDAGVVGGLDNLSPSEFLASLARAALDPPAVGLLDRTKLKSWARALAQGWGPAGAVPYQRRSLDELVDKIDLDDLNEPAEEEEDGDAAAEDSSDKESEMPLKTPAQAKRRGRPRKGKDASFNEPAEEEGDGDAVDGDSSEKESEMPLKTPAQAKRRGRPRKGKDAALVAEDADAEEEDGDQENESAGAGTETAALSTGRLRKKSKYLSPPYVDLIPSVLHEKLPDSPKESLPGSTKKKKPLWDNVDVGEVLELVRSLGEGLFHGRQLPKAAERFLGELRSSKFAGVDVAALVSDPAAALKLGKSVLERSRKKVEGGVDGSSTKRKRKRKIEEASPTATLDFPAENAVAKDSGADVAGLVSDSTAALVQGKVVRKRGRKKKDQDESGGPSVKRRKVEKTSPKATPQLPAENVAVDASAEGTGLVPHSCATVEQGKGVSKRGRKKKDQDGSGRSPSKRKNVKKTSPTAILDPGLVITPAIPIRQMSAEDLISRMRSGGGAGMGVGVMDRNKMELESPIPAAMSGGMKSGEEQDQADDGSVVKTPVTAEATKPGTHTNVENVVADLAATSVPVTAQATKPGTHTNVENVVADLAATSVQAKETKRGIGIQVDMNVQSGIADAPIQVDMNVQSGIVDAPIQVDMNVQTGTVDAPIRGVQMEAMELETNVPVDTNEQVVVTDLPVRSGLLPEDGGISQPADGNTNNANVEVSTVQGVVADVAVGSDFLSMHGGISQLADGNTNNANIEVSTVQGVVADLAVGSGFLPMHGGISQPTDGNTNNANVKVRAVQESYPSLGAMVPEMYKKVNEITTGPVVTATNHAFKATGEAIANHALAISTNRTYSDAPNSTPQRRNKKAPQYFSNPAEILLYFTDGVFLPSKKELLAAFSKFGILIKSACDILEDVRGARVVFGKGADADAVYARRETPGIFGQFGPPFATLKVLRYLPPFIPPPSALKPPLGVADMKKNVESMISSLAAAPSSSDGPGTASPYLLGEMQRLLSKLNNKEAGLSSSASAPPP